MKLKKKLLIWGGVISILFTAFLLYCFVMLVNNVGGIKDSVMEVLNLYYGAQSGTDMFNFALADFAATMVCNGIFGIICFVFSGYSIEKFTRQKRLLLILTILGVIFGLNFITLILILFAAFNEAARDLQTIHINSETVNNVVDENKFFDVAQKITILKTQLTNGEITEEQYKAELNKIISEQAKQ